MATDEATIFGVVSIQECRLLMEESMEIMDQIEAEAKQKVFELSKLNDSTVELRNFVVVLSIAFSPLVLVALLGLVFSAACSVKDYGVSMLFVWLSLLCFLYSVVVFLTLMHQRRRASDSCAEQASQQERQDVYAKLQQYAEHLKTKAPVYNDSAKRAAFCQKRWLASVALLGLEASMAASSGYFLTFLQAFGCSLLAALGSGALLGHVHGTLGPPNASQLEVAAAALARCPWVAQALAAVASLGMPFVEESSPSAAELQIYGSEKLEKATRWMQKVEALRGKLQTRTGRVLDTAASLEKAIGGTSQEREESIKDLTCKAAANAKGIASAATKLLGFGPQEGEAREEMKAIAEASGHLVAGTVGLALNGAGVSRAQKQAIQAEQAMRGGLQLLKTLVK